MDRSDEAPPAALQQLKWRLGRAAELGPLVSAAISATVCAAWLSHSARLYQALPWLFAMRFNSALGMLLAAMAFALHLRRQRRAALALAAISLLLGVLMLAESMLGWPPQLGVWLAADWTGDAAAHGGVVPFGTAVTNIMLSMVVLAFGLLPATVYRNIALQIVSLVTIALGCVVLIDSAVLPDSTAQAMHWRQPSEIGAVAAIALAMGMLADSWRAEIVPAARVPIWLPILYTLAVATFDMLTPLELNVGIAYIPLVLFALGLNRPNTAVNLAAFATVFIVLGLFLSPRGNSVMWMALVDRMLTIACIWLMAFLINAILEQRNRSQRDQQHLAAAQRLARSGSFEISFRTMVLRGSQAFDAMHARASPDSSWSAFVERVVAPDDRAALMALVEDARRGQIPDALDYSFLGPDNAAHNAVLHVQLMSGVGGAPAGLIGVVQDVTEARRAQAQQAEIEAQLRHAQKLEALGELSGGIAHDLNNTLLPVTMLVPALLKTAQGNIREGLEIIAAAADRARELVREILMFSRKDPVAKAPLRLDALVQQALPILRAGIPATVNIATDLAAVPEILGSKGQLYQTLLNLVTNGARAIGSNPGTVTIRVGGGRAGGVQLSVIDDGIGMDSATRARIFEPFFTSRPDAGGTGLGLAIVHGIVNAHGGTINVASAPGEGTRFDLVFPALTPQEAV